MPWQEKDRRNKGYGTAEYRRKREACLRAANWRCEIQGEGCTYGATEVDHVDGIADDPNHNTLRAACHRCHAKATAKQAAAGRQQRRADPEPLQRTRWW